MTTTELVKPYATPQQYRGLLELRSDARDEDIEADLIAGGRYLDARLNRRMGFNKSELITRVFIVKERDFLEVDDICDVTGLEVKVDTNRDGTFATTVPATDFELRPLGALTLPEPRPYHSLWRLRGHWQIGPRVSVKAYYGWSAVPKPIERATIRIASLIRGQGAWSTTTVNADLNTVLRSSAPAQNIIGELLRDYWRPSL